MENVIYEGVFLKRKDVTSIMLEIRGSKNTELRRDPENYHATTEFKPSCAHEKWYGEEVIVKVTGYMKDKELHADFYITGNEGLSVELDCENTELKEYLDSLNKSFHITVGYDDKPKYTNLLDFSKAKKVNFTLKGKFGGYYPSGIKIVKKEV